MTANSTLLSFRLSLTKSSIMSVESITKAVGTESFENLRMTCQALFSNSHYDEFTLLSYHSIYKSQLKDGRFSSHDPSTLAKLVEG